MTSNFFFKTLTILRTKTLAQIILVIFLSVLFYDKLPTEVISWLYAISLALKSILLFVLPFLIMSAISILAGVSLSNFINLTLAYFFGINVIQFSDDITLSQVEITKIVPAFILPTIKKIPNGFALIFGLLVGISCSLFELKTIESYAIKLNKIVMFFLSKIFSKLLPLLIAGSFLKLLAEGEIKQLVDTQLWATLSIILLICGYLCLWFIAASGLKLSRLREIFLNILPAMITAFTTMSSAATMPFALEAAEKNTKDKTLANAVIPMIMNFHMLGSSMAVSVAALIIMNAFNFPIPNYANFAVFGFYFVLNKFAGAGVPAGSIIVALPILKSTLGFSDDMNALVLAFYILFDPIITMGNVTANNLFVLFVQKTILVIKGKPKEI
jgi:Na+/H+-dicarboxylate symporter